MPYKFIKTPDPNSDEDMATIRMTARDDIDLYELFEIFKSFALACGYQAETVKELEKDE